MTQEKVNKDAARFIERILYRFMALYEKRILFIGISGCYATLLV